MAATNAHERDYAVEEVGRRIDRLDRKISNLTFWVAFTQLIALLVIVALLASLAGTLMAERLGKVGAETTSAPSAHTPASLKFLFIVLPFAPLLSIWLTLRSSK